MQHFRFNEFLTTIPNMQINQDFFNLQPIIKCCHPQKLFFISATYLSTWASQHILDVNKISLFQASIEVYLILHFLGKKNIFLGSIVREHQQLC